LITNGDLEEARSYLQEHFKVPYERSPLIKACLDAMHFLNLLKQNDLISAITFSQTTIQKHVLKEVQLPSFSPEISSTFSIG